MCNEEIGAKETDEGADHMAADIIFDDKFNKAQEPVAVSDPRLSDSERDRNAPADSNTRAPKQVCAQRAVALFGIQVQKIPRPINSSDVLTHSCNAQELKDHLFRAGFHLRGSGED